MHLGESINVCRLLSETYEDLTTLYIINCFTFDSVNLLQHILMSLAQAWLPIRHFIKNVFHMTYSKAFNNDRQNICTNIV